ncbi:hypothetical protein C6P98_00760 [Burkholderia multivorans]|uniref:Uncharacterized protein n=1 Tax=Burkholderia multivorans TaxID=87883 RepID=A0A8E2RZU9_9BURK|nr:hypothetical protein C6P98_00760 [Burkholderia multivorans]QET33935.1 hypothetical protein FOB31_30190 [Burkholderia multivorans]QET36263.1 hypothetical protein FOB30_00380 [Burkholderia multivorans]
MSGLVSMVFGTRGGAGQARARMRRASVDRYLIDVRPVLINVFIADLVEVYGSRDRFTAMTPESAV